MGQNAQRSVTRAAVHPVADRGRAEDALPAAESAAAGSALPEAWHDPDARAPIPGDRVRTVAGVRVHCINGVDYLSTSTVLSLSPWGRTSHVPPAALEYGATRGKYVDQACRFMEAGTLDWEALDPKLRPYVESWRAWLSFFLVGNTLVSTEDFVRNDTTQTFGYTDRRFRNKHDGFETIVDLKTSVHVGMRDRLQLADYASHGEYRLVVQATKTGTPIVHEFKDASDYPRFAMLAVEAHAWLKEEESRPKAR
jgi:hypothetical protein